MDEDRKGGKRKKERPWMRMAACGNKVGVLLRGDRIGGVKGTHPLLVGLGFLFFFMVCVREM